MQTIDACLVCGEAQRTIVSEYNRLIFMDSMWQNDLARFNYALCHGCGLVYASRRPDRTEYEFLYEHFNEFLMRRDNPNSMSVAELTPEKAAEIDNQFVPWWELRSAPAKGQRIRKALYRDLDNTLAYLPYIMLHVSLEGAKVLHIRAKGSTFADLMKRLLGAAQVDVITLFPTHKYLAEKNAGIRATSCLDYENFQIPFEDKYNLILENHLLIHMMDPNKTFEVFASHLEPGGALFLHHELEDAQLFRNGKNLFAELRPFHYHQFDIPTLERLLRRYGFEVAFLSNKGDMEPELFGLAKLNHEPASCPRISAAELNARLDMYTRWRDESILSLPKARAEALYGAEIDEVWKRVKAQGGLRQSLAGTPAGIGRFKEVDTADDDLFIGSKTNNWRRRLSHGIADRLRGTRLAAVLGRTLRGTRAGEWLRYRVIETQPVKKARRTPRSKHA